MATTTNYSWSTPDDTALVKDGAAAIRSLGTAIDSTVFTNAGNAIAKTIVDAKGDLIVATAADTVARLASSASNGDLLTVDTSTASGLKWAAPAPSGGMTLISETVLNANSGLNLTSIPGTYKQLFLVWSGVYHSGQTSTFDLRLNNNSSANAYAWQGIKFTSASAAVAAGSTTEIGDFAFGYRADFPTSLLESSKGWLQIDNYASTTKLKSFNISYGFEDNGSGNNWIYNMTGIFNSTSAITSIDVVRTNGTNTLSNIADTSIRLYGIS